MHDQISTIDSAVTRHKLFRVSAARDARRSSRVPAHKSQQRGDGSELKQPTSCVLHDVEKVTQARITLPHTATFIALRFIFIAAVDHVCGRARLPCRKH